MKKSSKEFLKKLLCAVGPTGYEREASLVWAEEAKTFADDVYSDAHGNVFAVINKGGGPRVMFSGHVDEIGLQVATINEQGFLHINPLGGWDPQVLVGQRVWVMTESGPIDGVIGKKAIHKMKPDEREKASKIEDLWVDIGAKDKADAESMVCIGDCAVLAQEPIDMPNNRLVARATDDRCGAFVALESLRALSKKKNLAVEVYAVATVQEEIGLRGAHTSAYSIDPAVGIAIDVTFCTDHPGMEKKAADITLGAGAVVSRGPNINSVLFDLFRSTAKDKKIDIQIEAAQRGTGTDANAIQLARGGVATGLVSIPNRYMHSPSEMVQYDDIDRAIKLISETVNQIDGDTDFTLGV